MAVLTSWTALDESEPVDGARDLLGTGAIADKIADEIAPNLRQGTNRARYYTMLAIGARVVEDSDKSPSQRLRHFFRWERLWLAAVFEHHAQKDPTVAKLQNAIKTNEDGLLGAGIRGASSRKFLELRDDWWTKGIDLEEFVPLKAPQTSGAYGRYAGSARDVKVLSDAGGLNLGTFGKELVASFEEDLGQSQFFAKAKDAVVSAGCSLKATLVKNLADLRLTRPQRRERELLTECLLDGNPRTRLAAQVVRQALDCTSQPTQQQWKAAVPKCAKAARALGDEGVLLADALLAAAAYDGVRSALESLFVTASKCAEDDQRWHADLGGLDKDFGFSRQVQELRKAVDAFRSSPDIEATEELRLRVAEHDPGTLDGVAELLCAQHEAVCQQRGVGVWVRLDKDRLEFSRRITGATGSGLARYRLGSLVSLIRDLQWKAKA